MKIYYIENKQIENRKEIVRSIKNVVQQIYVPIGVEIINPVREENYPDREFLLQGDDGITVGWVLFESLEENRVAIFKTRIDVLKKRYKQPLRLYLFVREMHWNAIIPLSSELEGLVCYQYSYLRSQDKDAIAIQKLNLPQLPKRDATPSLGDIQSENGTHAPQAAINQTMKLNRHEIEALVDLGLALKGIV